MSPTLAPAPIAAEAARIDVVACPLCSASARDLRFREGAFSLWRCTACRACYVSPRLPDRRLLAEVYDQSYWRSPAPRERGYRDYAGAAPLLRRTFERRYASLRSHLPAPGRVLDVGCASGAFLEVMRDHGWSVRGLEPSAPMAREAKRRLGQAAVLELRLEEAPLERGGFELVTFWDVLEHLPDPVGALRVAAALLAPEGRLLVETQDPDSLCARLLGRSWHHYKHAEHLVHLPPRALDLALERAGLRRLAATTRAAGKHVDAEFLLERSARLHPRLPNLLAPLRRLLPAAFYVNLLDERIVLAGAR